MLRVVADTNIILSAFIWEGNEYKLLEKCLSKEVLLIVSLDTLQEFKEVALRPKFGFTNEQIDDFINAIVEAAAVVQPTEKLTVCRDPEDDKFLEAALEGKADYIVSGDKDLLALKKFRNAEIVNAAEFLRKIK